MVADVDGARVLVHVGLGSKVFSGLVVCVQMIGLGDGVAIENEQVVDETACRVAARQRDVLPRCC